jgi:predicted phage terminase large subunit-like protein
MKEQDLIIRAALKNPEAARQAIERAECESSFYEFVKAAWHVLHPGEQMIGGWAMERVAAHLQAVSEGEISRLLINVPPGFAKSLLVNVMWPAWEWGPRGRAHLKYISASYERGLSIRDLMLCRDLLKSEWYQDHWGDRVQFKADSDGKQEYANTSRGWRYATSVGAGLTGRRGHRFIIDDPHSVKTAESEAERETARFWFSETVPTRFVDQKNPVYVIIMQRLHEQDISGLIINKLHEPQKWTHLVIPMEAEIAHCSYTSVASPFGTKYVKRNKVEGEPLPYWEEDFEFGEELYCQDPRKEDGELAWPERFDEDTVAELKAQFMSHGGSYAQAAQLQQRPVPRGGGLFQREHFQYWDTLPPNIRVVARVRGWDLAASDNDRAAWTVGAKLAKLSNGMVVVEDIIRFRGGPAEVEMKIKATAEMDGHQVIQDLPQDPGQAGKAQKRAIGSLLQGYRFRFSLESGDKEIRAMPFAAQVECGNVALIRAPWNDTFLAEACIFPNSEFKDQVDAVSRAYAQIIANTSPILAFVPNRVVNY